MYEKYQKRTYAPRFPIEQSGRYVCRLFKRCKGCPFPKTGFICWHADGTCLKTDREAINRRKNHAELGRELCNS